MKKILSIISTFTGLVAVAIILSPTAAFAQYGQYGGNPPVTQITLNKTVQDPASGNFVDNLGVNNTLFQAGQTVTYHLDVTNNGTTNFGYVNVTDTLPAYLNFISGPGTYNQTNRQLTFQLQNLTPGSTQEETVVAQIVPQDQLPSDDAEFCIVNAASLQTDTGQTASDTAQICIGQPSPSATPAPTVTVTQLPATGSNEFVFGFVFLAALGIGIVLRKAKY